MLPRIVVQAIQWFQSCLERFKAIFHFKPVPEVLEFLGAVRKPSSKLLGGDSDVKGASQIWFPKSTSDVVAAIQRTRNLKTFVRSGNQAAASDEVDAAGGVVINLAALKTVTVSQNLVNAEPAAKVGTVAEQLENHGLALPLIDNREKSIAANLLSDRPSCLLRTLGVLSNYLVELDAVSASGEPMTLTGASAAVRLRDRNMVITNLVFKPTPAGQLWMVRKSFPYPGKEPFANVLKALFLNSQIPPQCDVVLDAVSARHDIPLIRITAAGNSMNHRSTVVELVAKGLSALPNEYFREIITEEQSSSSVVRSIVEVGHGIPVDPQVETRRVRSIIEPTADANDALNRFVNDVDRGLSFGKDRKGKSDKRLRLYTRVQRNREDRLELSGLVYTRRQAAPIRFAPLESMTEFTQLETSLHPGGAVATETTAEGTSRIPDFQGEVYVPTDLLFELRASQYATSSYPEQNMTPFMVAYPLNASDIQAAVKFARASHKSIVARSGGHSYSGLSSGGDGTIVVSMDAFGQFKDVSENVVDAGPAIPLTVLAASFHERGITIPHGECPLVCIGGHLQTGGYGHLARGFGLALDYVKAFTIVLADGSVRTINRPNGSPLTSDDEIFWGVLGGNAGSFGIITNYQIECVKDADHPHSYGFSAIRKYEKQRYATLMKEVQKWTQGVAAGSLAEGIDFMMSVESSSEPFLPPIQLVELVASNLEGANETVDGDHIFAPIINAADQDAGIWSLFTSQGPKSLSELSDSFVRRFPETTLDGREFKYPYKKRINCTRKALTDQFVDELVEMVDKVVTSDEGVYLVFQMMIGGGQFQNSKRRPETSIPRRDSVFTFVFDLFYDAGMVAIAEELQSEMQQIIDGDFNYGQEERLFWGCFGDVDITKPAVRGCYYDDVHRYDRLQQLKKRIDPEDLFHSPMTVKCPELSEIDSRSPTIHPINEDQGGES